MLCSPPSRLLVGSSALDTNVIYCGDNLEVLAKYVPDESVDLIYIDPPFNSSRNYEVFWGEAQERRAFNDRFGDAQHYLEWMRPRIRELYRVLKPTGSFYYHCDWHASHYVKVELDRIFGFDNYRNEIIWAYRGGGVPRKDFARKHDTIHRYSKTDSWTFNVDDVRTPYSEDVLSSLPSRYDKSYRSNKVYEGYRPNAKGKHPEDWWPIQPLMPSDKRERLGYPTQKPLALLERIVLASSNPGDIVLDAFCGCGTTLEAAAKFNRQWVGIDFSPTACRVIADRLGKRLGLREGVDFNLRDMPKTEDQLRRMPPFEFENWAVVALGGIPNKVKVGDYGIDGRLYLADISKERRGDFLETLDVWYPIQVKQMDRTGRPDIDKFETAMRRDKRVQGYFVSFGFSQDAIREIQRANREDGIDIKPITVEEILHHEQTVAATQ